MNFLNFWVDIEDASGNRYGSGPVYPPRFLRGRPLSQIREFAFEVSPADPNYSAIAEKRRVVCRYIDGNGDIQIFGGGIIDKIVKNYQSPGAITIRVSGPNTAGELNYKSVRGLQIGDPSGGDFDAPEQIMDFAPAGWSINNGTTVDEVYIGYDGQSVLNALSSLSEGIGEHWRLGTGRVIEWLGSYSTFAASGVRAIKTTPQGNRAIGASEIAIIKSLNKVVDAHELVARIYPRGAGNGSAIFRLEALTDAPPAGFTVNTTLGYVELDAAIAEYGEIEKEVDFKNIGPLSNSTADKENAANQLLRAAVEYLRRWATIQAFYSIQLGKLDQLLEPGTTIRVVFKDTVTIRTAAGEEEIDILDIDTDLNIVDVTDEITREGISTTGIQVSTIDVMAMNDQDFVIAQIEEQRVFTTHAQLSANARWLRSEGSLDDSHDLTVPFWFGNEVVSINRVTLRFQINKLRSNTKSASSGGGSTSGSGGSSTPTSSSGGSSTPTSSSGGSSTPTTSSKAHQHFITALRIVTPPTGDILYLNGAIVEVTGGISRTLQTNVDGAHDHTVTIAAHTHTVSIAAHTHTVSIPNHTHSTPNHTHSLTYGIFEETAGNTLTESDITIKINGVTFAGSVTSIAGGWYEADITSELIDSAFSPDQQNNEIEYSTGTAKTASIITDLNVVDIIQAVSIL